MRQTSLVFITALAAFVLSLAASAEARTTIQIQADHIAFYYDRFLVEADGHVRLSSSDGTTVEGDAFSMDLKLNRFLVASNVRFTNANGTIHGAAIADFLDYNRLYFIPVTGLPDRWTYLGGDVTHPLKGREMPGDVFSFPDLSQSKPNLSAQNATIGARSFVRFSGVTSYIFGAPVPLPSFYVNFSPNQDLAQNSLSGANLDATWNVTGNDNSISAVHVRSDSTNGAYLSGEQHLAGSHDYAVFSINPATKRARFFNFLGTERLGKRFQFTVFSQLYTNQRLFEQPVSSANTTYLTATQAMPQSSLQAFGTFTYYNLLGPTSLSGPSAAFAGILNHPSSLELTDTSFSHRIGRSPFYEQLRYGIGFNHDSYTTDPAHVLQQYGGYVYTTIWNHYAGFDLYVPSLKFGNHDNPYKTFYFNGSLDKQRTWNSVPHYIDVTNTTLSVSRQFVRSFNAYASYSVVNTGDFYHGSAPYYVPSVPVVAGNPIYGFAAFHGVATLRTLSVQATYSSNPNFLASVFFRKHTDFPAPYPGLFSPPPLNVLGQYTYSNYLGQPPYDITGEVRARLAPHVVVDVQRSYFFNFGNLRWSPRFIIQVSQ